MHTKTVATLNNQIHTYVELEQFDEALECFAEAYAIIGQRGLSQWRSLPGSYCILITPSEDINTPRCLRLAHSSRQRSIEITSAFGGEADVFVRAFA